LTADVGSTYSPVVETDVAEMGVAMANFARVQALVTELDKLAKEYIRARDEHESKRQVFQAAKEKLVAVRKVAPDILGNAWHAWTKNHPEVQLVGMEIGEAIVAFLRTKAYESAIQRARSLAAKDEPKEYKPSMTSVEIAEGLDAQGFEFRTASPRREVHAALLNLKGITKVEAGFGHPEYQVDDHAETYQMVMEVYGVSDGENGTETDGDSQSVLFADAAVGETDDDVPF
jgi:hypothetical protein